MKTTIRKTIDIKKSGRFIDAGEGVFYYTVLVPDIADEQDEIASREEIAKSFENHVEKTGGPGITIDLNHESAPVKTVDGELVLVQEDGVEINGNTVANGELLVKVQTEDEDVAEFIRKFVSSASMDGQAIVEEEEEEEEPEESKKADEDDEDKKEDNEDEEEESVADELKALLEEGMDPDEAMKAILERRKVGRRRKEHLDDDKDDEKGDSGE